MKYSEVITLKIPRQKVYPRAEADMYCGGKVVRETLERLGYLAPLPDMGSLKQRYYDVDQMDAAISRWAAGEAL